MINLKVYSIAKSEKDKYSDISNDFIKMSKRFSNIEDISIFTKSIQNAHKINENEAKNSYTTTFLPKLEKGFNIALSPNGKILDSFQFSKLLNQHSNINFFIGGAYGFDDNFLNKVDRVISLSPLTMSHKIAKVVLYEQIYRGFTILENHPYHK